MPTRGGGVVGAKEALDTARHSYDAYRRGDVAGMVATWAEGITFHAPGHSVLAGTFRGEDEVLGFLQRVGERSEGTFRLEVHDVLASNEHLVVLCRLAADRDGRVIDMPAAHIWHPDPDGKFTEVWFLVEDQGRMDEFWA